ncbi:hypothetical protein LMG7974_01587 [Campylobacter majalis]|uniref:Uncharacterized protein n=1 Tax=Campylobacter majalis TaxID=2790656 RepID=A0ABM8Q9I9_9BACT|nr:hypothetical protein [Campylobacter majalis]CAD7289510.1 hypothetical protein LMG7974_01587 [Campylobacter majalis]
MSSISTIEEYVLAFAKYAKDSDDDSIKQIGESMLLFFEANKNKVDLNTENAFMDLYYQEMIDRTPNENESIVRLLNYQIFLEFTKCYDNLKSNILNEDEATKEFKEQMENIKSLEKTFTSLQDELNQNSNLKNKKEQLELEIKGLESGFLEPEPIKYNDLFDGYELKIQPKEMIDFINNKEQIEFPFNSQDTLKNPSFMKSFYMQTLAMSNNEIQKLINQVKEKNHILEQEINAFKNEKTALLLKLSQTLSENNTLTSIKYNQEEAISESIVSEISEEKQTEVKNEKKEDQSLNYDYDDYSLLDNPIQNQSSSSWQDDMLQAQQDIQTHKQRYRK